MQGTAAELDFMLADSGVPMVYNGVTVFGLFDVTGLDELTPEGIRAGERLIKAGVRNGAPFTTPLVVDAAFTVYPYQTASGAADMTRPFATHIRDCGHPGADGMRYLTLAEG